LIKLFFRRIRFTIEFTLPNATQRAVLWKYHLPPHAPTEKDINFQQIGEKFQFSGGNIKNACYKAAAAAALRTSDKRKIFYKDLIDAAEEELQGNGLDSTNVSRMFN